MVKSKVVKLNFHVNYSSKNHFPQMIEIYVIDKEKYSHIMVRMYILI